MPIYKLAAFDMDGTLLNSRKQIPDSAVSACRRAQKAGRIIAVDTGRAVSELTPFSFAKMGYDFQEGRVLAKRTIPSDLVPLIVEASRREDLMFQAMIDGVSYVEAADVRNMEHYRMSAYQALYEATTSYAEDVRAFTLAHADQVNKINMYHTSSESRARTLSRLSELALDLTFAEDTSLEATPQGVTKGTGLVDLCEVLGLSIEEAIGVGDAFNDIPMLEAAGLGIAMGNSNEAALNAADVVVADNDHDGIAEVIDRYLLGS